VLLQRVRSLESWAVPRVASDRQTEMNMQDAEHLRKQAEKCRRLAREIDDKAAVYALTELAEDLERRAGCEKPLDEPKLGAG
jgi:hypothetical protein